MPCPEYDTIEHQCLYYRELKTSFHSDNAKRHGLAESEAKASLEQAQAKVIQLQNAMTWHKDHCQTCKNSINT